jgi:hypothetical protein
MLLLHCSHKKPNITENWATSDDTSAMRLFSFAKNKALQPCLKQISQFVQKINPEMSINMA